MEQRALVVTRVQDPVKFASTLGRLSGVNELDAQLWVTFMYLVEPVVLLRIRLLEPFESLESRSTVGRGIRRVRKDCFNTRPTFKKENGLRKSTGPERRESAGITLLFQHDKHKKKIKKRPAEQRDPMESLLRRITKLKTSLQLSGHGVEKCCLDKQLLGDEAPALWHLVGHPPQATHLDRTI